MSDVFEVRRTAKFDDELGRRQAAAVGRTCSTCTSWWTGTVTCHCTACHRTFTTPWTFDAHRIGAEDARVCVDPGLIEDQGQPLQLTERGGVFAWNRPIDEAGAARLARLRGVD